jgi:hypothetical protein
MTILSNLYSWQFGIGLLVGFLLSRVWEIIKVCELDKQKPLPSGKHRSWRKAVQVDPRWFTGAIAIVFLLWSVYTTQANTSGNQRIAAEAKAFAAETRQCQRVLIVAIQAGRVVTSEYNRQSEEQRNALADWLRTLLSPPPEIARLDGSDPVRQQWAVDVTSAYFNNIQKSQQEQAATNGKRPPLPDPDCGS